MYKIAKDDQDIHETLKPASDEYAMQLYDINDLPDHIVKDDLVKVN